MTNDLVNLIARAADDINPSHLPTGDVLARSRRETARKRRAVLGAATALTIAAAATVASQVGVLGGTSTSFSPQQSPEIAVDPNGLLESQQNISTPTAGDITEGWGTDLAPTGAFAAVADNAERGYVLFSDIAASEYDCTHRANCGSVLDRLISGGYLANDGALTVPVYDHDLSLVVGSLTRGVVYNPGAPLTRPTGDESALTPTIGDHAIHGYMLATEQSPTSPEQALYWQTRFAGLGHGVIRNVYDKDGATVLDISTHYLPRVVGMSTPADVMSVDCADPTFITGGSIDYLSTFDPFPTAAAAVSGLLRGGETTRTERQGPGEVQVAILRSDGTTRVLAKVSITKQGWLIDTLTSCGLQEW